MNRSGSIGSSQWWISCQPYFSSHSSFSSRSFGRVRGVGEVGARALAAVADRAAEAVDRVRAVGVEVEARRDHLPLGVDGRRARRSGAGATAKTRRHRLAVGVLVVAEPVDPLVAGRAAVVAGDVLEVVVDRQLGEADLLDLGRRGGQVDAGQAAEPGEQAEVLRPPSARSAASTRSTSRVSFSCSFFRSSTWPSSSSFSALTS